MNIQLSIDRILTILSEEYIINLTEIKTYKEYKKYRSYKLIIKEKDTNKKIVNKEFKNSTSLLSYIKEMI